MKEELKIRINNYKEIENSLVKTGAKFLEELDVKDTYFNQEQGRVLKITEDERGFFLVELKEENGKFKILKYKKIDNPEELKKRLQNTYGIKCILTKKRRFFKFKDYNININLIEDIGDFLIVEGENLNKNIIIEELGIQNPEFITKSFDQLKQISK